MILIQEHSLKMMMTITLETNDGMFQMALPYAPVVAEVMYVIVL